MTDPVARTGHGYEFRRGNADGPPETYTFIPGMIAPNKPALNRTMVDATHTRSTNKYKEFIPGLREGKAFDIEFEVRLTDAQQRKLYADFNDELLHDYQVVA